MVADLQGLTDNGSNPQKISANVLNVVADYLAVGIDPLKTTVCLQSALAELTMYYLNLVSVARLERNPTVKSEIADKGELTRILRDGTRRAHRVSQQTLAQVKAALGLDFFTLE
ncbi:Tryptophan--tRNA ligase 2 [Serratia entomophila]|nr:Tryptophan--tRNA ligase 2 [Serratia entomophila]CAI1565707.1 Tryptophan--tRNA ligase 2 [Serratia entomophila]CAI1575147.1 Tryptophan--tRNA ligase 2 [Serratia entomophila]CAI1609686.1 Tryptophan--tRNA ligase 2 [Serratia entomophila]CAI1689124.1 Tryptophan--tRNA ligase 2 [Serratia entomophila]